MAAIDLLFDVKKDSERLHQLVLGPLLIRTCLLAKLGVRGIPIHEDFEWEPRGRMFDLGVKLSDPEGANVWVEIKVDGSLNKNQVERQVQMIKAKESDSILYILLGHSQHTSNIRDIDKNLFNQLPHRYQIITAPTLCMSLGHPDLLLSIGAQDRDVRDLATAYLNWLRVLQDRYSHFGDPDRSYSNWNAGDCYGFFCWCRDHLNITDMGMDYVANPSGGFFGAWWEWHDFTFQSERNSIYLQFEFAPWRRRSLLCLRVVAAKQELCATVRDETSKRILKHPASSSLGVARAARMGSGEFVTAAVIDLKLDSAANLNRILDQIPSIVEETSKIVIDVANSYSERLQPDR